MSSDQKSKPGSSKESRQKSCKKRREPVEFTLDVNVDFGDDYQTVEVVKDRTVVMPERLLEFRERSVRLLFRSIGQAIALQPKVMREILPVPYNVASSAVKKANQFSKKVKDRQGEN